MCIELFAQPHSKNDIIYVVRMLRERHRVIQERSLKHFNQERFINNLEKVPCNSIQNVKPNHRWEKWKELFDLFLLLINTLH